MFVRAMKAIGQALCLTMALTYPAAAVTVITPQASSNVGAIPIVVGETYAPFYALTQAPFTHYYNFTYSGDPLLTVTLAVNGALPATGLTIQWLDLTAPIVSSLPVSIASSAGSAITLAFTLTSGAYSFVVNGLGGFATYTFNIQATPLPPALVLFGTALIGMTLLRRRRRAPAPSL